jgi:hypothetical protein
LWRRAHGDALADRDKKSQETCVSTIENAAISAFDLPSARRETVGRRVGGGLCLPRTGKGRMFYASRTPSGECPLGGMMTARRLIQVIARLRLFGK